MCQSALGANRESAATGASIGRSHSFNTELHVLVVMTYVVPFDGSRLAESALERAVELGAELDAEVVVVSVIPERKRYAREKGWIGDDEPLDVDSVVEDLRDRAERIAPGAEYRYERIKEYPSGDGIADHIARLLEEYDPSIVFLGSENVGRVVTPLASVGVGVAAAEPYDVYVVRQPN